MKQPILSKMMCLLLILISMSCEKDEICVAKERIQGEWIWMSSYGGEAGETLTPENTMTTERLEIGKSTFKEFRNDSLIRETTYILTKTDEPVFAVTNILIELRDGNIVSVVVDESELEILEGCFDCYSYKYERQ